MRWALLFLAGCDAFSGTCAHAGCGPTVDTTFAIPMDVPDGATVELCRNHICATGPLPALPMVNANQSIALAGALPVTAYLSNQPTGLEIAWEIDEIDDGDESDRFTATLSASDGTILAQDTYKAMYNRSYPNGESCGDGCVTAVLIALTEED